MPAYNFKKRFAQRVESQTKQCTIRRKRKRPTVAGQTLYLYTGMRTSKCRKLGEHKCLAVHDIEVYRGAIYLGGVYLSSKERWELARFDGFECTEALEKFLYGHYCRPFKGEWIVWGQDLIDWHARILKTTVTCAGPVEADLS